MTSPSVQNAIQIDGVCSASICEEIADRLRTTFAGEADRLPQHIKTLVEQMVASDRRCPTVRGHSVSDGID